MSDFRIRSYQGIFPNLADDVYVDPTATVIGRVSMAEGCSVWPMTAVRGDVNSITIGKRCNLQDGTIIHVSRPTESNPLGYPTTLGDDVSIAHKVMLHGCTIGNRVLIGMGAIVLDGAIIEDDVMVGAGSLVSPGKRLTSGFLYLGTPARQIRPLSDQEKTTLVARAYDYATLKNDYTL